MPASFLGTTKHTLDDKGRLIVPKRFLDEIPPKDAVFTVTASFDGCLLLMDRATWQEVERQFSTEVVVDRRQRAVRRLFLGYADVVTPDRQNRVVINEALRTFAGVATASDVVLVGTGRSIEIWAPAAFEQALLEARQLGEFFDNQVEPTVTVGATS